MRGVKLKGNKDLSINDLNNKYIKPDYVYIPFASANDKDITELVKKGDYIYKGQAIGRRKGNFSIPILSSVSGMVEGYVDKYYGDGVKIKCCVIKNDFKENENDLDIRDNISKISYEDFINILKEKGIVGMGGSGFPTYIKYQTKNMKTLIINAVECEPYITADYNLILKHPEEILEAIDAIITINKMEKAIIAIKENNTKLIKVLNNYIGSYLNIKIVKVKNLYPMGWEKSLVNYIINKDYNKLPSEVGVIINNVSTIYAIFEALKYNKALTERYITITGNVNKPQNILVKIGSLATDIIKEIGGYNYSDDMLFISGGPMMGNAIPCTDLVITPNINCILITNDNVTPSINCLRCGKCVQNCPAKIAPVLIKDYKDNIEKLKELKPEKCIECGICSYICPSKINVREYVISAKEFKKRGKHE